MTTDAVGGVWTYALELAAGLAARGVETVLALLGPPATAAQRDAAAAVPGLRLLSTALPLDWLAESSDDIATAGEAIAAIAVQETVDLVHLNSPALAARARFPLPVVGLCHSCLATWWLTMRSAPMPEDFAWRTSLLAEAYAAADVLVAPSAAFAEATAAAYGLPRPPRVVHNGRCPLSEGGGRADFVFTAGRLWDEGKNIVTLDRAAARLALPLRAAGPVEGPNGARITPRHLRPLGSLDQGALARILAQGPVFASAARYEPFGLAVLEAAQAGCALVLADIPSFRELWDGAALFAPPEDDGAFAAAMMSLLEQRERRAVLCAAAKERARRYGREAMAEGMLAIYRQLMRGDGAAAREAAA